MSPLLEEVVARGVEAMGPEATAAQMLALLRQVGELENSLAAVKERNADLENGIKAISAKCYWRSMGYCDLACPGRVFCDVYELCGIKFSEVSLCTRRKDRLSIGTRPA